MKDLRNRRKILYQLQTSYVSVLNNHEKVTTVENQNYLDVEIHLRTVHWLVQNIMCYSSSC